MRWQFWHVLSEVAWKISEGGAHQGSYHIAEKHCKTFNGHI